MELHALNDKWSYQPLSLTLDDENAINNPNFLVGEFIDHESITWDIYKLYETFHMNSIDNIVQVLLNKFHTSDRLIWDNSPTRCYTVRSGYLVAHNMIDMSSSNPEVRRKNMALAPVFECAP